MYKRQEVFYGNDASSAVLKKCGMVLEGIARQKYYKNGEDVYKRQIPNCIDVAELEMLEPHFVE